MPKPDRRSLTIRIEGLDRKHYQATDRYARQIKRLYDEAAQEYASLAGTIFEPDPNKPFSFADYPRTQKKAAEIAADLTKNVQRVIEAGQRSEWLAATYRADEYLAGILDRSKLTRAELEQYEDRNIEGLAAFQGRKVQGLNLSDRVWRCTDQFTEHMELALDVAIGDGRSAQELSRDVRGLLNEPNRLFRRVRDKYGNLRLSKAAAAYHPGRGVYRSSYQNAMRLARTEINMAYKTADWERWQRLDFVVGIRIGLSNNHTIKNSKGEEEVLIDICDELAGDYPKTFKFVGWHPNCRCMVTPILQSPQEMHQARRERLRAIMNDEAYKAQPSAATVTDVPAAFTAHVKAIAERSKGWKSQPYWIRDNFKGGTIAGGLSPAIPHKTPLGGTPTKPNLPPKPCTDFDDWIDDLKAQAFSLGLDISRLDPLRAAGQREPLKTEVDRLRALADDRSAEWLAANLALRNFVKSCKDAPADFRSKYADIAKTNAYDLKRYYETCIATLTQALTDAQAEWEQIKKAKEKSKADKNKITKDEARKELAKLQKEADELIKIFESISPSKARTLEDALYRVETALRGNDIDLITERLAEAKRWLFTYQNPNMPRELHPGGDYLKKHGDDYEFNTDFFRLLDEQPTLVIKDSGGSYETYGGKKVVLDNGERNARSQYHRRAVVYHEFGHAIGDQRGLIYSQELKDLREKQRARLRRRQKDFYWTTKTESNYNLETDKFTIVIKKVKKEVNQMRILTLSKKIEAIYNKIVAKKADDPIFNRYGITQKDAREQITGLMDTLRSLVNRNDVGWGHSVSYFKQRTHPEHEYLAHCFENAFLGNRCFQLLMPVEYQEMIDYIRTLKPS